jgi:hypothetical protein
LVKLIVTVPSFAVSDILSNLSCPVGSAAMLSVVLLAPAVFDGIVAAFVDDPDAPWAPTALLELALLLPHPTTATASTTTGTRAAPLALCIFPSTFIGGR